MARSTLKTLIVDDDRKFSGPLAQHLRRDGQEVVIAETAVDALRIANLEAPDAVLLELALPDANAYTIATMLRSDILHQRAPIIIVSREHERFHQVHDHVADLQLTKPIDLDLLPGLIRYVISKRPR